MTTYYAPTKLYIGEEEKNVGEILKSYGYHRVLFLYGGGSIKKNGLYDTVITSLKNAEIEYIEEGGVEPNPKLSFVRNVLKKDHTFDFILAVGGGSVIDTAKSIAVSYKSGIDPWEFNSHRVTPTKAMPLGVILTISAAGSEMSSSCVISNLDIPAKQGFNSDYVRPVFAIMNPKLTYSVSKYQTSCGVVDILMHTLERYISPSDDELCDEFALGLVKTVLRYGKTAYQDPTNYEARKNIMLASSFSHNGLTNVGRPMCFRAHQFEHAISALHDEVSHGAGLAIVWPAYSRYIIKKSDIAAHKFQTISSIVFGFEKTEDQVADAIRGIDALEDYFKEIGMPTSLKEIGIKEEELEILADMVSWNKTRVISDVIPLSYPEMKEILLEMYK